VRLGIIGAAVLLVLLCGMSCYDYVEPGEVGVIKNNVTGAEQVKLESGLVLHLPFGLTDVFRLDRTVQVFSMTKHAGSGDRRGVDNVKIKVSDGSNVEVDVEVNYRIIPANAADIIRRVGPGDAFKNKMIRSYTRAILREKYGVLTLENISDPASRTSQNVLVKESLNDSLEPFGLEVTLINTTNFTFDKDYERLVKEKKAKAQEFRNQAAAQEQAVKEQEAKIASVTREKNTSLIVAAGKARKRLVTAENSAKQLVLRAEGEAYAKNTEGDRDFEVATNEAQAIETEGLNTAQGILRMAEAYQKGGDGLVKEALAKKLMGAIINGRPYSLSERIERIQVDRTGQVPAAVSGSTRGGGK
jgi:regulator of protease activity HflC (stomatin/prohibitin superfamily)